MLRAITAPQGITLTSFASLAYWLARSQDIVRDYVINQKSDSDMQALQKAIVDVILAARPEGGFPISEFSNALSFEGYIARQLWWHLRGSLGPDEDPSDALVAHLDIPVRINVCQAVGLDKLVALSEAREAVGELGRAGKYLEIILTRTTRSVLTRISCVQLRRHGARGAPRAWLAKHGSTLPSGRQIC